MCVGSAVGDGDRPGWSAESEACGEGLPRDEGLGDCFCLPALRGSDTREQRDRMIHLKGQMGLSDLQCDPPSPISALCF